MAARDIEADYRAAYLAEYRGLKAAGRDEDAAAIAEILRDHYGHGVEAAVAEVDTEKAVPPAPTQRSSARRAAPRKKG